MSAKAWIRGEKNARFKMAASHAGSLMTVNEDIAPHLFEGELELLSREMQWAGSYLEFGMGGSTLLAAQSGVGRIVSIDSDAAWVGKITGQFARNHAETDAELIHCDIGLVGDWGAPLDREAIENWPHYFRQPWQRILARGQTPDLIYIDGRFRVACALYSLLMLHLHRRSFWKKTTRIIVHDFPDRPYYGKIAEFASVVASVNTLRVFEQKPGCSPAELVQTLLTFQFDFR